MKIFTTILVIVLFCSCSLEDANVIGPAGGFVFYDKGNYSDGWRYLEASPKDAGTVGRNYLIGECTGGSSSIGKGKQNTDLIIAMHITENDDGVGRAVQLCSEFNYGGYNDWFLPSKDELTQMIETASQLFAKRTYLTSTHGRTYTYLLDVEEEEIRSQFVSVYAEEGSGKASGKGGYIVRLVRRF